MRVTKAVLPRWFAEPLACLGEELFPISKAIGFEKKPEDDSSVGCHRLVLIARRAPHELTGPAYAFVVFERSLENIGLFKRCVLV